MQTLNMQHERRSDWDWCRQAMISAVRHMARTKELVLPVAGKRPDLDRGSIFFVGTATVIIRYAGFTILTDPNFLHRGDHAHLGYGLHTTRITNPAIEMSELPPLDLVVLSHMHEDHFD